MQPLQSCVTYQDDSELEDLAGAAFLGSDIEALLSAVVVQAHLGG